MSRTLDVVGGLLFAVQLLETQIEARLAKVRVRAGEALEPRSVDRLGVAVVAFDELVQNVLVAIVVELVEVLRPERRLLRLGFLLRFLGRKAVLANIHVRGDLRLVASNS